MNPFATIKSDGLPELEGSLKSAASFRTIGGLIAGGTQFRDVAKLCYDAAAAIDTLEGQIGRLYAEIGESRGLAKRFADGGEELAAELLSVNDRLAEEMAGRLEAERERDQANERHRKSVERSEAKARELANASRREQNALAEADRQRKIGDARLKEMESLAAALEQRTKERDDARARAIRITRGEPEEIAS